MKITEYARTLGGALQENKLTRYVLLGLVLANVVLAFIALTKKDVIVLVPPGLTQRSELAENQASAGVKESWATYIAMTLGNVTPRTAPYLTETLGKVIAPRAYKTLLNNINEQTRVIEDQQVTVQFVPNEVFYLPESDVVVVSGEFTLRGMRDAEKHLVRTYEIGMTVQDYMVRMDSLKVYEGPWSPDRAEIERKADLQKRTDDAAAAATRSNG